MNKEISQEINNILSEARGQLKYRGFYIVENNSKKTEYVLNGLASEKVFEKMVKDIHKVIGYKPQKR